MLMALNVIQVEEENCKLFGPDWSIDGHWWWSFRGAYGKIVIVKLFIYFWYKITFGQLPQLVNKFWQKYNEYVLSKILS